jgi:putative acetyltransferase
MIVRPETPADHGAVRAIVESAFGGCEEAELIDRLRVEDGAVLLSLVAESDSAVFGHILFSRMFVGDVPAVALAPVAVAPDRQREGIGAALIVDGLDRLRAVGERIVLVVGHPDYYPRFGFSADLARTIESPFPADAFMALELVRGALQNVRGRGRYAAAFGPL